jgi:hypothetical protein
MLKSSRLIKLLVLIAIIGILGAILLPALAVRTLDLSPLRDAGGVTVC